MSEEPSGNSTGDQAPDQAGRSAGERTANHVVVDVLVYAAARLLLVVALTGVIYGIAMIRANNTAITTGNWAIPSNRASP